jgi:topoisomerase-4 subunit A
VPVAQLPSARGDGAPVTSMIDLESGSKLIGFFAAPAEQPLLMATGNGYGFTCKLGDMLTRQRGGKQFVNVEEGAEPLRPQAFEPTREARVACVSEKGRLLVFEVDEVKQQSGGGRGVTLMGLDDDEKLLAAVPCDSSGFTVLGLSKAGKPQEIAIDNAMLKAHAGTRARKGTLIKSGFKPVDIVRPSRRAAG